MDEPDVIRQKIRKAVTDTDGEVRYDPEQEARPREPPRAVRRCLVTLDRRAGRVLRPYGPLKADLAEALVAELAPVRERYAEIIGGSRHGARPARARSPQGERDRVGDPRPCPGGDRPAGAAQLGKTRLKYQFWMSPRNLERAPWSNRTSSRTSTMNPMRIR